MKASPLLLDRLEFLHIHVAANQNYDEDDLREFPQLGFNFKGTLFQRRSALDYPPEEAEDPRHFLFRFAIKLDPAAQKEGVVLPYDIEVEASAFFRYLGEDMKGVDRFRAVRASGYPMLYGAIREMVANLSARGPHGLLQLPSANFARVAERESKGDEEERLALINSQKQKIADVPKKRPRAKRLPQKPEK